MFHLLNTISLSVMLLQLVNSTSIVLEDISTFTTKLVGTKLNHPKNQQNLKNKLEKPVETLTVFGSGILRLLPGV